MDKIFYIYLARADGSESGIYVTLSLPATSYQMQDAFDKLRLANGETPYWEVTEYLRFEELSQILNESCGLSDLNTLAQKLSELSDQQSTAFAGLLQMGSKKNEDSIPISRLIDLAHSISDWYLV